MPQTSYNKCLNVMLWSQIRTFNSGIPLVYGIFGAQKVDLLFALLSAFALPPSIFPLHFPSTFSLYIFPLHFPSTSSLYIFPLHLPSTFSLYIFPYIFQYLTQRHHVTGEEKRKTNKSWTKFSATHISISGIFVQIHVTNVIFSWFCIN